MALKIVKGSIDRMFDKNLQDLVRGIRNHKEDEVKKQQRQRQQQQIKIITLSNNPFQPATWKKMRTDVTVAAPA